MYRFNLFKLLYAFDDYIPHLNESKKIENIWKYTIVLTFFGMIIFTWSGYLGIGSDLILNDSYRFTEDVYESNKFWFIIGRAFTGILYCLIAIFLPVFTFKWLFSEIALHKLISMQLVVLFILLIERLTWIPLVTIFSIDWFASPFSLGVITSYLTSKLWIVYFFGAISLFECFIIYFQIKFLTHIFDHSHSVIYVTVFILHFIKWWFIALLSFISPLFIQGIF